SARRDRDRRREGVRLGRVRRAGHYAQMFSGDLVVREVEVVKFRAVIVAHESRQLLVMLWLKLDHGGGAVAVGLLPSRDERLLERAADRLAADEAEVACAGRERKDFLGIRRAQ